MHPSAVFDDAMQLVGYHRPDIARVLRTLPMYSTNLEPGQLAVYQPRNRSVTLSTAIEFDVDTLAHSLVHEGTHALDHVTGILPLYAMVTDPRPLVQSEIRAFTAATRFWERLYPYGKLPPRTLPDHMANRELVALRDGSLDINVANHYTKLFFSGQLTQGTYVNNG